MGRRVNLAVVGTGRMGRVHVRNVAQLIPEANLVALCDLRLEVAQALADELGIRRVVKDHRDLLTDKDIEAVLVTASTDAHAAIMKDWAKAGKHIFCEKPLAMDLASIDEVLRVVKESGVKLQVGFNRRFDRSFRRVREIVASGRLGRPSLLRITNRDPEVPAMEFMRLSGGMFLDMTIHDFDMARFQVGEVEEVYAAGCVLIEPALAELGDIDTGAVILKFAGGALGLIDNSRKAVYGYDQRLEVFCAEGVAMAENESETTLSMGDVDGFHASRLPHFFMQRFASCYVDEVRQFLECVRDDRPVPITGADGRAAVVLGHAAFKSMRENRPVRVSEIRAETT